MEERILLSLSEPQTVLIESDAGYTLLGTVEYFETADGDVYEAEPPADKGIERRLFASKDDAIEWLRELPS